MVMTKILLAKTSTREMMLRARMAFKPKNMSGALVSGRWRVAERCTHRHGGAASWRAV